MNISVQNPQSNSGTAQKSKLNLNEVSTTFLQKSKDKRNQFVKNLITRIIHNDRHSQCTLNKSFAFKPTIQQLPFNVFPQNKTCKLDKSRQQIRQKLIIDGTQTLRERMKKKIMEENKQLQLCTFKPKISQYSQYLAHKQSQNVSIHDKLFQQAEIIRQQKLQTQLQEQRKQRQSQAQQLLKYKLQLKSSCLHLNSEKHNLKPIQFRIEQIMREKISKRKQLQQKILKEQSVTFHPQISNKSNFLSKNKNERNNFKGQVVERLMKEYELSKKRKQQLSNKVKQKQQQQCTFKPDINLNFKNSRRYDLTQNVIYQNHQYLINENQRFVPIINQLSDLIVQHTRGDQDLETKLYRLSIQPLKDKQNFIQNKLKQIGQSMPFQPKINQFSKINQFRTAPKHYCQYPEQQNYSYQPKINENSRLMRAQSLQLGKLRMKKRQLQYKLAAEYEQLKECSFQPKINNKRHEGQRIITQVEGAIKYINLQQKTRERASAMRKRQDEIFKLQLRYDERRNKSMR